MARAKITKTVVDRATIPARSTRRQTFIWDNELRGFGLLVSSTGSKSFVAQAKGRRVTIGRYPDITAQQARTEAHEALVWLKKEGKRPRKAGARGQTLEQAIEHYLSGMRQRGLSETSMDALQKKNRPSPQ